jgi:Uma2 family endonuclease
VFVDPETRNFPERGFPEAIPDLVAEVRSPSDSWEYVVSRGGVWIAHGVPVVWCIDPLGRRAVELRQDAPPVLVSATADASLRGAPVLADLEIPLARLLRGVF